MRRDRHEEIGREEDEGKDEKRRPCPHPEKIRQTGVEKKKKMEAYFNGKHATGNRFKRTIKLNTESL